MKLKVPFIKAPYNKKVPRYLGLGRNKWALSMGVLLVWSTVLSVLFFSSMPTLNSINCEANEMTVMKSIYVFYNVYANPASFDDAKSIAREQLSLLRPEHHVFVRTIGAPIQVENATLIQHDEKGSEIETLRLLRHHCLDNKHAGDVVVYIHNKGSYHPSEENTLLRRWLTTAALSRDCSNMPPYCNVCSFRMSPLPHPHTPGNMWSAKCNYIKNLLDPVDFQLKMKQFFDTGGMQENPWEIGTDRFAAEHWVHSHPKVDACDLSSSSFLVGYGGLPSVEHEMKLVRAPRYDRNTYTFGNYNEAKSKRFFHAYHRLEEYKFLYNETPPETWFGWSFYNYTADET